jgi:hypothetical protein
MDIKTVKFPWTATEILGGILVVNTVLAGGVTQLTDLFGQPMTNHILAVTTLGTGICGGFLMRMGSMSAQMQNVRALPGVDRILVNGQVPPEIAAMAMDPAQAKISPAAGAVAAVTATAAKAAAIVLALLMGMSLLPGDARAQTRKPLIKPPALTGDIGADIKTDLSNVGVKTPTVTPGAACDFNIFAALDPQNVVTMIQNCVSDANKPFLPDVQAALDSATAYKDKPGMDCLTPALAIVQAAVGTPAVIAADGTVTTPAKMAGIILIFQKFREFTLANGPAACKNWVQSTVNGVVAGTL